MATSTPTLPPLVASRYRSLEQHLAELQLLPSSFSVPMKVLELKRSASAGAADFAAVVSTDPALAVKVLALANSAAFAPAAPVTQLSVAIGMIGLRNLLPLVFGLSFAGIFNKLSLPAADRAALWRVAVLKGVMARQCVRQLSGSASTDPAGSGEEESAFFAGLFQDVVLPVMYGADRSSWQEYLAVLDSPEQLRLQSERRIFGVGHAELAGRCARKLELPEFFAEASEKHHDGIERLRTCATEAQAIALDAASCIPHRLTMPVPKVLKCVITRLGASGRMDAAAIVDVIRSAADEYQRTMALFSEPEETSPSFKEFLQNLSAEVAQCMQGAIGHNATQINSLKSREEDMRKELLTLHEKAQNAEFDSLTRTLTRSGFMSRLADLLELGRQYGAPCAIGFVDIDNFKKVNDTYGHAVGDIALVKLSAVLTNLLAGDGAVGRMGGDEFVFAFAAADASTLETQASSFISALSKIDLSDARPPLELTSSIGIVNLGVPPAGMDPVYMLQQADGVMYQAKRAGKARGLIHRLGEISAPANAGSQEASSQETVDQALPGTRSQETVGPGLPIQEASANQMNTAPPAEGSTPAAGLGMRLTEKLYRQIISRLKSEKSRGRGVERRRLARVGLRVQVLLLPCRPNEHVPRDIWLRDISAEGIGFVFPESLDVGSYVLMSFPGNVKGQVEVLYRIVRCHQVGREQYSAGAQFQREIGPREQASLNTLEARSQPSSPAAA